ncbi:MAG: ATP synthase F1 subunit epsilon [Pseudomonadota bacterium]|nr:ATP synthase F1 subunit epsilon [Pseudomonadota bacterium]
MMPLQIKLMTAAAEAYQAPAVSVLVPTADGYLGIYANHAPLLAKLGVGILTVSNESGEEQKFFIADGSVHIADNVVKVLADVVEQRSQINVDRAKESKQRAEQRLKNAHREEIDIVRANASLQRALARIAFCD